MKGMFFLYWLPIIERDKWHFDHFAARAFSTGARAGASAGFRSIGKVAAVGAVGVAAYAYSQSKCISTCACCICFLATYALFFFFQLDTPIHADSKSVAGVKYVRMNQVELTVMWYWYVWVCRGTFSERTFIAVKVW